MPVDGITLLALLRDLRIAAKRQEATVLLTIDQAEELLSPGAAAKTTSFLSLLRAALEVSDRQLMVLATMRSDFLGKFQTHPVLHDPVYTRTFPYEAVTLDPMPLKSFPAAIQGPARLAGLKLEDGLVEAMMHDTGTPDALPLLAFTLRRLYDRYGQDGCLGIREYDDLGRIGGAIRETADHLLRVVNPSTEELGALRTAFLMMVQVNEEGEFIRRHVPIEELPQNSHRLIQEFVENRLLVTRGDAKGRIIEVAHEALLRHWPLLTSWLNDKKVDFHIVRQIRYAAISWEEGGRVADDLLRGTRLQQAKELMESQGIPLEKRERCFIAESDHIDKEIKIARRRFERYGKLKINTLIEYVTPYLKRRKEKLSKSIDEVVECKIKTIQQDTFFRLRYRADVETWKQENIMIDHFLGKGTRWHPEPAKYHRTLGPEEDYVDVYIFPCCNISALADFHLKGDFFIGLSQFRDDGCQDAPKIS